MKSESKTKIYAKRIIVFAVLIGALSGAVYLNWQYSASSGTVAVSGKNNQTSAKYLGDARFVNATVQTTKSNDDYFSSTRANREQTLKKSLDALNEVIGNIKSTNEAKSTASAQIVKLTENSEAQTNIESLIIAKGFADCVAVIKDKNISVVVKCGENGLLNSETKQIQDIILTNSQISLENIRIIEIK